MECHIYSLPSMNKALEILKMVLVRWRSKMASSTLHTQNYNQGRSL